MEYDNIVIYGDIYSYIHLMYKAKSKKQNAKSKKQNAKSKKQKAKCKMQKAKCKKQKAKCKKQKAKSKMQNAKSKMQHKLIIISILLLIIKFMFDDNQNYIIYVSSIIFVITFILIGVTLYYINKNNDDDPFPKQEQACPDYWEDRSTNLQGSKCINSKDLGKCKNNMDFSKSIFKGSQGVCNKAKWATMCDLSWDGITNNKRSLCKINNDKLEKIYSTLDKTDYFKQGDIKNLTNTSISDCELECTFTDGCNAFTYDNNNKTCYLKKITDKNKAIPSYSPNMTLHVIGDGFKSYKDLDNICSSENKSEFCKIKESFTNGSSSSSSMIKEPFASSATNINKQPLLKNAKCNVKLLDDGNLVIYDSKNKPLWASNTYNKGKGPYNMKMKQDGNLVILDNKNEEIWQSRTSDKGEGAPYMVTLNDSCAMEIKDDTENIIWKADETTAKKQGISTCSSNINYGHCNNKMSSSTIDLIMQDDGNLVIYDKNGGFKWASRSHGKGSPPYRLMMQTDGNLVIYDKDGKATWATGTNGKGGAGPYTLNITDDKNVVMSSDTNKNIWSSRIVRPYSMIENTDYVGQGDIKNIQGSVKDCEIECDYTQGCTSFFYDNNGKRCYLKNVNNNAKPRYTINGSMYTTGSGFKSYKDALRQYNVIQNTDYGGQGDIKNIRGSVKDCQIECDFTNGCTSFFYDNNNKICYLKNVNNNAIPRYAINGSMYTTGSGFKSYKDKTPYWKQVGNENTTNNNFTSIGDTRTLSSFNVNCGDNGIKRFAYGHNGGWDKGFRYKYNCSAPHIDNINVLSNEVKSTVFNSTGLNDAGGGANIYLDRHAVDCGGDGAIASFKMETNPENNKYKYNYKCIKMKKPMSSRMVQTPANDAGGFHLAYLDRHNVACADNEVMNYFRLVRPSGNQIAYQYRCSKFT